MADRTPTKPILPTNGDSSATSTTLSDTRHNHLQLDASYPKFKLWFRLFIAIVLSIPALFVVVGTPHATDRTELTHLVMAQEMLHRFETSGDWADLLIPTFNQSPELSEPPMGLWMTMVGWINVDIETTSSEALLSSARYTSALAILLTIIATYWAGMSLGGLRVALFSAITLGTTYLTIRLGRQTLVDNYLLMWSTIAIASGLWAMRPLRETNWISRRVFGWLICGLSTAAVVLTLGPLGALFVIVPLIAAVMLTPYRRLGNTIGLIFSLLLGLAVAGPWYLYIVDSFENSVDEVFGPISVSSELFVISSEHMRLLLLGVPWIVWVIGGLFQPFLRARHERRRQLLFAWCWFVLIFVFFSIPAANSPRYLLPIVPAGALMVGQLFAWHESIARQRQHDPGVDRLRIPHWGGMLIASFVLPCMVIFQGRVREFGERFNITDMAELHFSVQHWSMAAGLGAILVLTTLLGIKWHFAWKPARAFYATAVWMMIASTAMTFSYVRSGQHADPNLMIYANIRKHVEAEPGTAVTFLKSTETSESLHPAVMFHVGKPIPPVTQEQLDGLLPEEGYFVIAKLDKGNEKILAKYEFRPVADLSDFFAPGGGKKDLYRLYKRDAKPAAVQLLPGEGLKYGERLH